MSSRPPPPPPAAPRAQATRGDSLAPAPAAPAAGTAPGDPTRPTYFSPPRPCAPRPALSPRAPRREFLQLCTAWGVAVRPLKQGAAGILFDAALLTPSAHATPTARRRSRARKPVAQGLCKLSRRGTSQIGVNKAPQEGEASGAGRYILYRCHESGRPWIWTHTHTQRVNATPKKMEYTSGRPTHSSSGHSCGTWGGARAAASAASAPAPAAASLRPPSVSAQRLRERSAALGIPIPAFLKKKQKQFLTRSPNSRFRSPAGGTARSYRLPGPGCQKQKKVLPPQHSFPVPPKSGSSSPALPLAGGPSQPRLGTPIPSGQRAPLSRRSAAWGVAISAQNGVL